MPHTRRRRERRVDSGTWPYYVISLTALLASSAIQVATWSVPPSVANSSPSWFDFFFAVAQPIGAATVLAALFWVKSLIPSLQLERVGCIINAVIGISYVCAVAINNDGPPTTAASWLVVSLAVYSVYRIHEISKVFGFDVLKPFRRDRGADQ